MRNCNGVEGHRLDTPKAKSRKIKRAREVVAVALPADENVIQLQCIQIRQNTMGGQTHVTSLKSVKLHRHTCRFGDRRQKVEDTSKTKRQYPVVRES